MTHESKMVRPCQAAALSDGKASVKSQSPDILMNVSSDVCSLFLSIRTLTLAINHTELL